MKPRPAGFDYRKPDVEHLRCVECNSDGLNRTGLKPTGHWGACTSVLWAFRCPSKCRNGLKEDTE